MNKCEKCGGIHWRTAPCVPSKKSTAAQKVVPQARQEAGSCASTERRGGAISEMRQEVAGTQALPVDTNSANADNEPHITAGQCSPDTGVSGNHPESRGPGEENGAPKFDKKAWMKPYMKTYMAQYRADVKAGIRKPKSRPKK